MLCAREACVSVAIGLLAVFLNGCGGGGNATTPTSTTTALDKNVISLDATKYTDPDWGQSIRLTVHAHPILDDGSDAPPQELLLDTGSSTLAFCATSLQAGISKENTNKTSCACYGADPPSTGFWGPNYNGKVNIEGLRTLPETDFAIMTSQYGCCDPSTNKPGEVVFAQGIFGIAFQPLNSVFPGAPTTPWPTGPWNSNSYGQCPNEQETVIPSPLIHNLKDDKVTKLGIYWSGLYGKGEGKLYLDQEATSNSHYREADVIGPAIIGEHGYYDMTVTKWYFGGQLLKDTTQLCSDPDNTGNCIFDTGNPSLEVPREVFAAIDGKTGNLTISLAADGAPDANLTVDVGIALANKWIAPSDDSIALGMPIKAFYYFIYDIAKRQVSFVPTRTPTNCLGKRADDAHDCANGAVDIVV